MYIVLKVTFGKAALLNLKNCEEIEIAFAGVSFITFISKYCYRSLIQLYRYGHLNNTKVDFSWVDSIFEQNVIYSVMQSADWCFKSINAL